MVTSSDVVFEKLQCVRPEIAAEISIRLVGATQTSWIFDNWCWARRLYRTGHGQKASDPILRRDLSRHGAR